MQPAIIRAALLATAFAAAPAFAQHVHGAPGAVPAASAAGLADGEVRKVDPANRTVTLKHGPIASIAMPPMTMVFKVADPKLLDGLKPGDKVRFAADKAGDDYRVTRIEPMR
jgi:Cu/Ag efflux protein CusF